MSLSHLFKRIIVGSTEVDPPAPARLRHARPGFIIIGAQEAGTAFLFDYLSRHPRLRAARETEVRFFDQNVSYERGREWYEKFFPLRREMQPGEIAFEASPNYLFSTTAPARIAAYDPTIKLIAVLRNPVERAYSAWNMYRRAHASAVLPLIPASRFDDFVRSHLNMLLHATDYPSFEQAIEADLVNPREEVIECDIVRVGYYDEQLSRYLRVFGNRRILVVTREEMVDDLRRTAQTITDFLEIESFDPTDELVPQGGITDEEPEMSASTRARLEEIYRPHNEALRDLIGRDPGWQQ